LEIDFVNKKENQRERSSDTTLKKILTFFLILGKHFLSININIDKRWQLFKKKKLKKSSGKMAKRLTWVG